MAVTTARKAPQDRRKPTPKTHVITTLAAAQAEADGPNGEAPILLAGHELDVLPVGKWRTSAMKALRTGDLDAWAEKCLTPESWELWQEIDPTMDEASEFLTAWTEAHGENTGK